MRYLDTGSRDPDQALGAWLESITADELVAAVRWQSGFFGAQALGYFIPTFQRLATADGTLRLLVGSNDGTTSRRDVEVLLEFAGPARKGCCIGVVAFDNAYYHPKTLHFTRSDGSEAAYIGSANLTRSGVASLHVEAGLLLDTRSGDDPETVARIRDAIDWWFDATPDGFTLITCADDLDLLVERGHLDAPRPQAPSPSKLAAAPTTKALVNLAPLRTIPPVPAAVTPIEAGADADTAELTADQQTTTLTGEQLAPTTVEWRKALSRSDAQRKPKGNQRGSITLVAAGYPINAQTYFRHDFFSGAKWIADTTSTGESREVSEVTFATSVLGEDLGDQTLPLSHAPNREASQANYTTLLHIGPLGSLFGGQDMTGRELRLERRADGSFALWIT